MIFSTILPLTERYYSILHVQGLFDKYVQNPGIEITVFKLLPCCCSCQLSNRFDTVFLMRSTSSIVQTIEKLAYRVDKIFKR